MVGCTTQPLAPPFRSMEGREFGPVAKSRTMEAFNGTNRIGKIEPIVVVRCQHIAISRFGVGVPARLIDFRGIPDFAGRGARCAMAICLLQAISRPMEWSRLRALTLFKRLASGGTGDLSTAGCGRVRDDGRSGRPDLDVAASSRPSWFTVNRVQI